MQVVATTGSKTCKAPVKSSPPTNEHPTFYRPDAFPVAQPTVPITEIFKKKSCSSEGDKAITLLPRVAVRKRDLCCRPVSVRLSVRMSVSHVRVLYPEG